MRERSLAVELIFTKDIQLPLKIIVSRLDYIRIHMFLLHQAQKDEKLFGSKIHAYNIDMTACSCEMAAGPTLPVQYLYYVKRFAGPVDVE